MSTSAVPLQASELNSENMSKENLLRELKLFYSNFGERDMSELSQFYAPSVDFIDPIHQVSGLTNLSQYFQKSVENIEYCRFEFTDQCVQGNTAVLRWKMHYSHPKIKSGKALLLDGTSFLYVENKIVFHQDYYDMGQMLYENLPVIGAVVRFIKGRVAP